MNRTKCHQPARISPINNLKNDDKVNSRFTIDSWKLGNWRARRISDLNFMQSVNFINYCPGRQSTSSSRASAINHPAIGFFINYSSCQKWFSRLAHSAFTSISRLCALITRWLENSFCRARISSPTTATAQQPNTSWHLSCMSFH